VSARAIRSLALLLALASGVGCASNPTLYRWGDYEDKLHDAYQNPEAIPDFRRELIALIEGGESASLPLPPGLYAEYGYALYLDGNLPAAIVYFERERNTWPESAYLMTRVIQRLEERLDDADGGGEDGSEAEPGDDGLADKAEALAEGVPVGDEARPADAVDPSGLPRASGADGEVSDAPVGPEGDE